MATLPMARHIPFSEAVNDAERWAFKLLSDELPENYILLTNIEIPTHSGQALEVDALVVGEWGVYVVDVKGYIGHLDAGLHSWSLDGRDVDNSLSKTNYIARVLAGKLKHRIPVGVYAPWCQGMVFVTGRKGKEILLEKHDGALSIYTPKQIVAALTKEWGLTAPRVHRVTQEQKEYVLDTIGQVSVIEKRNSRIQDFVKQKCLFIQGGLEIWQADYQPGDWSSPWLLKVLTVSGFDDPDDFHQHDKQLREEFYLLQTLAGTSGIPCCAPLIQDGEKVILPIRMPRGQPMSSYKPEDHSVSQLLETLRQSATAIQQIHRRGYTVGGWGENCIFIADHEVEFIDIRHCLSEDEDTMAYARCFLPIAEQTHHPRVHHWYRSAAQGHQLNLDELRSDLSAFLELGFEHQDQQPLIIQPGVVIDHHYQLSANITHTDSSELWLAKHIQGQYDCGVSIYRNTHKHWCELSSTYRSLSRIYHPHIEQVLSFGQLPTSTDLFIARAWIPGQSINELESYNAAQFQLWLTQLLTGLQYLHSLDIFHGSICPKNIICNPVRAVLVNFGIGLDIAAESYSSQYADPNLWAEERPSEKDLYALVASFVDTFAQSHVQPQSNGHHSSESRFKALEDISPYLDNQKLVAACQQALELSLEPTPDDNYPGLFDLNLPLMEG